MLKQYTLRERAIIVATYLLYSSFFIMYMSTLGAPFMLGLAIFVVGISNLQFKFAPYHLFTLQFCLYCFATTFWALNGRETITMSNTILQTILVVSVFYAAFSPMKDNVNTLIKVITLSGYTVVIYTYFFYGFGHILSTNADSKRILNSFNNVNVIGMLAALSITFHFYLHLFEKKRKDLIFVIPAIILIGVTESRKAIFMAIAGVFLLFFFKARSGPRHNMLPIIKFLAIATIIIALVESLAQTGMFTGAYERMQGLIASFTGEGEVDSSTSLREYYRQVGWDQFMKTPILGIGINNSAILLSRVGSTHYTYLHCNYAELAACGGLVGLISYYGIYLYLLVNELKYIKVDKSAILFVIWLFLMLTTDWGAVSYYPKHTYFNLMVFFLHIQQMRQRHPYIK